MKKKNLPLVIIAGLLIVALAVWAVTQNQSSSGTLQGTPSTSTQTPAPVSTISPQDQSGDQNTMVEEGATMGADLEASTENESEVRETSLIARQWEFVPSTIEVESGQPVRLIIENEDVDHGFYVPQLGIDQNLPAGETTTIEFTANQPGTYSFSCDVFCGQGHSDMTGQIIVN